MTGLMLDSFMAPLIDSLAPFAHRMHSLTLQELSLVCKIIRVFREITCDLFCIFSFVFSFSLTAASGLTFKTFQKPSARQRRSDDAPHHGGYPDTADPLDVCVELSALSTHQEVRRPLCLCRSFDLPSHPCPRHAALVRETLFLIARICGSDLVCLVPYLRFLCIIYISFL